MFEYIWIFTNGPSWIEVLCVCKQVLSFAFLQNREKWSTAYVIGLLIGIADSVLVPFFLYTVHRSSVRFVNKNTLCGGLCGFACF